MDIIASKTQEITDLLLENIENGLLYTEQYSGLYAGKFGILFYLAHRLRYTDDTRCNRLYERFADSFFDELTGGIALHTYCSGLAGIFSGLGYLEKQGLIDVDFSDVEAGYRDYLYRKMCSDFSSNHYDFMHGGLGVALHFQDDEKFIGAALDYLERSAVRDGDKLKWVSGLGQEKGRGYNIALSHGMSSIAAILCRFHKKSFQRERVEGLLNGCINYILSQEVDPADWGCWFPSQSHENEDSVKHTSRLGWCYGDLGVATTLWQAGGTLGRTDWQYKALEVMRFSAGRRMPEEKTIRDAGICHGSAGVAMIFNRMYNLTGDDLFRETHDYWINVTLQMARFPDGYAGYMMFRAKEEQQWEPSFNLLEGISGIGLVLDSATRDSEYGQWADLFLL